MPRIENWDEFAEKATKLCKDDPINGRVTMKYRHQDGKLNLKATDNKKVFQYLAEQPKEVKQVDKFISNIMRNIIN